MKKDYKEIKFERCVLNLDVKIKEWYQDAAAAMSLSTGQYMAVVLINHYRNELKAQTVQEFNDLLHSEEWKEMSDKNVDGMREMQMMFEEVMKLEGDKKE